MKHLLLNLLIIFSLFPTVYSNSYTTCLINYPNYFFVETGTDNGEILMEALESGEFNIFYSIEVERLRAQASQELFKNNPNISIILGDSALELTSILQKLNLPATFWLSANYGNTTKATAVYNSGLTSQIEPLIQELDQIKTNSIKTHTILISRIDWLLEEYSSEFTLTDIENAIYAINSNYVIEYDNAFGGIDNVLVAHIP